uniref:Uncharacterized protein n=1 Tax=Fagus sylvatica TaxID=28930 RepID=A0A2N9G355_FAGSY
MNNIVRALEYDLYDINITTGVEVVYFAAKILKKPNIEKCGLVELASEVGMDIKEPIIERPDWNAIGLLAGNRSSMLCTMPTLLMLLGTSSWVCSKDYTSKPLIKAILSNVFDKLSMCFECLH